jgi:hypothetical protein
LIKVVNATNSAGDSDLAAGNKMAMTGKVMLTPTMRTGVTSFALALGFGLWVTGAEDVTLGRQQVFMPMQLSRWILL